MASTIEFYDYHFPFFYIHVTGLLVQNEPNGYTYNSSSFGFEEANTYWDLFQWCLPRDAIMIFSGHNFAVNGIAGGQICISDEGSASIIQAATGLPAAGFPTFMSFVVAHELGHQLGASHADDPTQPCPGADCGFNLMCNGTTLATSAENATLNQCSYDAISKYEIYYCECVGDEPSPVENFPCPPPDIFDIKIKSDNKNPVAECNRDEIVNYEIQVQWVSDIPVNADLRFTYSANYQEILQVAPEFNTFQSKLINGINPPITGSTAITFRAEKPPIGTEQIVFQESTQVYPAVDFILGNNWTPGQPRLFSVLLSEYLNNGLFPPAVSEEIVTPSDIEVIDHLEIDLDNLRWGDWGNTTTPDVYAYTFRSMTFKLAPDAKIIISGTGEVNFKSCKFISCDEMWSSVEVGSDAKVLFNDCEIENAKNAIVLKGGAVAVVTNNQFRNNYTSMTINGGNTSNATDVQRLYGNTFEKTDDLFVPHAGKKSYVGIIAQNVKNLIVGGVNTSPNEFKNIKNGILAYNTNLTVFNSTFKFINGWDETQPLPQTPVKGTYAVYAKTDFGLTRTLKVFGYGKNATPIFANCQSAVGFQGSVGKILNCNMENVVFGVSALNNRFRVFDISNNRIEASGVGISLFHNTPSQGRIFDNIIDINDNILNLNRAVGIKISENTSTIATYNYYDIERNEINLQEGKAGIELLAGKYVDLANNTINLAYDRKQVGIYTAASTKALIKCNNINGPAGENLTQESKGIDVFSTFSSVISCNNTSDTYYGMDFNGSDDDIHLKGNNLYQHSVGLQVEATGAIGEQSHRGNRWYGPFDSWGARHLGNQFDVSQSEFYADGNASSGQSFDYLPSAIQATGQWFVDQTSGEIFQCQVSETDYCSESGDAWQIIPGDGKDIFTTVTGTDYSGLGDALAWNNKNHVYEQFREVYSPSQADLYSQYRNLNQDNIPELYNIKNSLGQLMQVDPTTNTNLIHQQNQIDITMTALQQNARDIEAEVVGAINQRTALFNQLESDITAGDGYATAIQSSVYNGLPTIITSNQSISSTDTYSQNEQTVNDIFLRTVAGGYIDIPVYLHVTIWNIANQCPLTGGEAVFKARSLYTLIDPLTTYDDDLNCQGVSPFEKQIVELQLQEPAFSLSPNPAADYVVIHLENIKEGNLEIQLINSYGQIIKTENHIAENQPLFIDIDALEKGMYFCKVTLNEESIGTKKLILLK